jgi:excisionase family DNA binding protein
MYMCMVSASQYTQTNVVLTPRSVKDAYLIPFPARKEATVPARALYTIPEVMELLSLSRTTIYALIRTGRLRAVREGRSRLVSASAIAAYVALLEDEAA